MSNNIKKHLDFILLHDRSIKIILRIYPRSTSIHGFHDEKPKSWDEVYKVYYSWAIIYQYSDKNGIIQASKKVFEMLCDESSSLPDLSEAIKYVMSNKTKGYLLPMGQPAAEWILNYDIDTDSFTETPEESCFFEVFNNWFNNGYRFCLSKEKAEEFAQWLDETNNYLLKICGKPC